MLNTPPHLEARVPRGFVSIFHGTSSSVARRRLRASDLSFRQSMPSFDIGRPGLQMQSGASAVLGGVGEPPGSRCTDFNPRAPCGARPSTGADWRTRWPFQSTRPVWGATIPARPLRMLTLISIHAPRVGRDASCAAIRSGSVRFQSTRPVWGATAYFSRRSTIYRLFQSTRPVWGATRWTGWTRQCISFQSTRPVWGATACDIFYRTAGQDFNPRAPCGARLWAGVSNQIRRDISIHAPRVGRDVLCCSGVCHPNLHFNPRAPCGARPRTVDRSPAPRYFNPRAPCGARRLLCSRAIPPRHFNPRAPCGARRAVALNAVWSSIFQSTRPVWGATIHKIRLSSFSAYFNPRAPCGARPAPGARKAGRARLFQSTRPVWGATTTA